jgi:hypothetical protein
MLFKLKVVILSVAAGVAIATGLQVREQSRSWGLLPGDAERALPGDDLVTRPDLVETRSLVIDVSPAQVWPWLVQLGYGRGGWYGFGPLDRPWSPSGGAPGRSADTILAEFQDLAVGDIVPTHRGGGLAVKVIDPEAALVLYLDDAMVREQAQESAAERSAGDVEAVSRVDMPAFQASWAFCLQAEASGGSRLVERFRLHMDLSAPQRRGMPMLGLGIFTLLRSQMLGIKRRAEGSARRSA